MNKKQQQEKFVKQLEDLLKRPENRNCADCGSTGPLRFASTNLGTFICTRCAGLHRKLGVHVTKVKSISHDAWTADQVQFMQQTGNKKAKEKYEYKAPRATTETDNACYDWIRRKYEAKEFLRPEGALDTGSDDDEPLPTPAAAAYASGGIQAVPIPSASPAYMSPTGFQAAPVPHSAPVHGDAFQFGGGGHAQQQQQQQQQHLQRQNSDIPSKSDLMALYNGTSGAPTQAQPQEQPAAPPGQIPVYMMGANGPVLVYIPASQLSAMQPAGQPQAAPAVAAANPFGAQSAAPQASSPFAQASAPGNYGQPTASPFAPTSGGVAQQSTPFGAPPSGTNAAPAANPYTHQAQAQAQLTRTPSYTAAASSQPQQQSPFAAAAPQYSPFGATAPSSNTAATSNPYAQQAPAQQQAQLTRTDSGYGAPASYPQQQSPFIQAQVQQQSPYGQAPPAQSNPFGAVQVQQTYGSGAAPSQSPFIMQNNAQYGQQQQQQQYSPYAQQQPQGGF